MARRLWERRKASAVPPGALTFHLDAWTRRALSEDGAAAAEEARARLDLDELLVLHGSAWLDAGEATLIVGPAGIGKSSALRQLEAEGHGHLVEEGVLLVGRRRGAWHLVLTGAFEMLARASRISRRIRNLMRVDFCLYQNEDVDVLRRANPIRSAILFRLSALSFSAAAAVGARPRAPFTPSTQPIRNVVVLPHPQDRAGTLRLRGAGSAEEIPEFASFAGNGLSIVTVSPLGELREVRQRLRRAVLTGA